MARQSMSATGFSKGVMSDSADRSFVRDETAIKRGVAEHARHDEAVREHFSPKSIVRREKAKYTLIPVRIFAALAAVVVLLLTWGFS